MLSWQHFGDMFTEQEGEATKETLGKGKVQTMKLETKIIHNDSEMQRIYTYVTNVT